MKFPFTGLFLLLSSAAALPGTAAAAGECAGAPPEAQLSVPAPADKLAKVACTKWGHMLQPTPDWLWTKPGGITPLFFPAQMVQSSPAASGHEDYFREITVRELVREDALEKWRFISGLVGAQLPEGLKALEIVAKGKANTGHTIYFFNTNWGYACSPECKVEHAFLLVHRRGLKLSW